MRHGAANQARYWAKQVAKVAAIHAENLALRDALRGHPARLLDVTDDLRAEIEALRAEITQLRGGRQSPRLRSVRDVILGR